MHRIVVHTPHGPVAAWRAAPPDAARGASGVVQEIFGVTAHIRDVATRFAEAGFEAIAPALFDPVQRDVTLDYDDAGIERGRALAATLGIERAVDIVQAAAGVARGRAGVVGFCWGGSVALVANARLGMPAVDYYGARSLPHLEEASRAPLLCHFGARDASIPMDAIAAHRTHRPHAAIHVYADAGHAFNRDVDPGVHAPEAAALAWERTLAFFREHLS